jgi:hypothetical protein
MKWIKSFLFPGAISAIGLIGLSACKSSKSAQGAEKLNDLAARLDEVERQVGILHNDVEYLKAKSSSEKSGFEVKRLHEKK